MWQAALGAPPARPAKQHPFRVSVRAAPNLFRFFASRFVRRPLLTPQAYRCGSKSDGEQTYSREP